MIFDVLMAFSLLVTITTYRDSTISSAQCMRGFVINNKPENPYFSPWSYMSAIFTIWRRIVRRHPTFYSIPKRYERKSWKLYIILRLVGSTRFLMNQKCNFFFKSSSLPIASHCILLLKLLQASCDLTTHIWES